MKELVIISGKGGTGKTSITASFAALSDKSTLVDCDVDAADLHILLEPEIKSTHPFISGHEAVIDPRACTACGECEKVCRFDAISYNTDKGCYVADSVSCEGCGVCVRVCKAGAVAFPESRCGEWYISKSRAGNMVHARLDIGAENSGKLVNQVRQKARHTAYKKNDDLIIIDGPPGIGCPAIASITGADYAFAVTEPTRSGMHDLERLIELIRHFKIPFFVCVNKWDINPDITEEIKKMVKEKNGTFIGTVSYDKAVSKAQFKNKSIVEYANTKAANEIKIIWRKLCQQINV